MSEPSQGTLPGCEAQRGDVGSDACFTPKYIIDGVIEALGKIDCDPCWHPDSNVPDGPWRYDGKDRGDGLEGEWGGRLWMNPPYSDPLPWADRFRMHAQNEEQACIALVKLDPTTKWWKGLLDARVGRFETLIGLVDHRIKFEGSFAGGGTPSFASAFIAAGILAPRLKRALPFADWREKA